MARNAKLNELINLKLVCKYPDGFEVWKTAYNKSAEIGFRVGRCKNKLKDIREPGNFESALIVKGVKAVDRVWEDTKFSTENFSNSFDWKFEDFNTGEVIYTNLTWLQNKNLTDALMGEVTQEGVIVIPKISEKTVDFTVELIEPKKKSEDTVVPSNEISKPAEQPSQPSILEKPKEPQNAVEAKAEKEEQEEEIKIDDLPF